MKIEPEKFYRSTCENVLNKLYANAKLDPNSKINKTAIQGRLKAVLDEISPNPYPVPSDGNVGKWLKGRNGFRGVFVEPITEFCRDRGVEFSVIPLHKVSSPAYVLDAKASEFVPFLINMNASVLPINGANYVKANTLVKANIEISLFPNKLNLEFGDANGSVLYSGKASLSGCWIYTTFSNKLNVHIIASDIPINPCGIDNTNNNGVKEFRTHIWNVDLDSTISRSQFQYMRIAHIDGEISTNDHIELIVSRNDIQVSEAQAIGNKTDGVYGRGENMAVHNAKKIIREHILKAALRRQIAPETNGVLISASFIGDSND